MPRRGRLLILLLLVGGGAWARVGGGQHYSGSHSSSSSHSSSRGSSGGSWSGGSGSYSGGSYSGGGGSDLGLAFFFVSHPLFTLALLVVAFVLWRAFVRSFGSTASTQRMLEQADARPIAAVSARDVTAWVDALQRRDPRFDLVAFLDHAKALFLRVQAAWSAGALAPVRADLSDATFRRLDVQLRLLQLQGVRNVTADVAVLGLEVVGLEQTSAFDTLHVRVRAQARDLDVPAAMPAEEAQQRVHRVAAEPFVEVWSFVRRPGVQSKQRGPNEAGRCPSCGAPFDGGAAGNCSYCRAIVNSGSYDWVLAEITQESEAGAGPGSVPGLEALRATDPALSLEVLEDRASLLFWTWVDAQSRARPGALAKVATASFVAELQADVEALRNRGRSRAFLQCAVGSVDVLAIDSGPETTHAAVEIRWSARMGVVATGSAPGTLPVLPQRWVFTLERKAAVRTDADRGMATARCGNCGAPLTDSLEPTCEHCGAALNDGAHDWVLAQAEPYEIWAARPRASAVTRAPTQDAVLDVRERQRMLFLMAAMARADGQVDDKELRMLKLCAERWGVPFEAVEQALRADPAVFERLVPPPGPGGETFLRSLVQMALVDGKVDRQERRMLEATAARLGRTERLPELLARFGLG
jgi:tellurite resistance protein